MNQFVVALILTCYGGVAASQGAVDPPSTKQATDIHVSASAKTNPNAGIILHVPDSSTFIAVRPNISRGAEVVGGIVGLAMVSAGYSEAMDWARDAIKGNERHLTINMVALTSSTLETRIRERAAGNDLRFVASAPSKGARSLSILPYVVLAYVSESALRPFVFLDAVLNDENGAEIRRERFVASASENRALTGDSGWTSGSGKPLAAAVAQALEHVLDLAVRDFTGKLNRASAKCASFKAQWPAVAINVLDVPGDLVEADDKAIIFVPGRHLPWSRGVYSIPKAFAERGTRC